MHCLVIAWIVASPVHVYKVDVLPVAHRRSNWMLFWEEEIVCADCDGKVAS